MTQPDTRADVMVVDVHPDSLMGFIHALLEDMEAEAQSLAALTQEDTTMRNAQYLLVSFVFGNSKTNGIIMGTRQELPRKAKDSKDFPGTFYKVVNDDHGAKKIYRYVPLDQVADFLEDTNTGDRILSKVLTESELDEVNAPKAGETWELDDGRRVVIAENGCAVCTCGAILFPEEISGTRTSRTTTFN